MKTIDERLEKEVVLLWMLLTLRTFENLLLTLRMLLVLTLLLVVKMVMVLSLEVIMLILLMLLLTFTRDLAGR